MRRFKQEIYTTDPLDFPHIFTSYQQNLLFQTEINNMKRMFSKKGLVESSKEENIEDVESDADLQE